MLDSIAFATSLAIVSGVLYVLLEVLATLWTRGFRFLFNAQFFGADVASLLPRQRPHVSRVGTLAAVVIGVWVVAFAWAWLYNRLAS
ncbi:MAG: hypothetical protein HYW08_03235 [candidate division NC10 bacterium]|nr:hypothetical protein [Candidatus Rokubacteria bacterium]MBI2561418.1 hypothetical protein [candidate division NC10 bacterium]